MSSLSSADQNALKEINKSLEEMKQLLKVLAETSKTKLEEENKYTIAICKEMVDQEKELFYLYGNVAYCRVMKCFEKKGWREIFVKLSKEQRTSWIQNVVAETCKTKQFEKDNEYSVAICKVIIEEMKKPCNFLGYDMYYPETNEYEAFDDETFFDVMKSFENKGWREVFVNMAYEQRKIWIGRVRQSRKSST